MGSYGGFSLHVGQILLVILIILILLVLASCVKIVPQAQAFIGVRGKILNKLTDEETARLQNSANKLKEVIHQITY